MKVSESDLRNRYSELEDFELASLLKNGNLTDEAKEILNREVKKRNINLHTESTIEVNSIRSKNRKFKSRIKSAAYGFLSGILIGFSALSASITNYNFTFLAEISTRAAIGIFIGIILFITFLFISEKTAKRLMIAAIAIFLGYFLLTFMF